MEHLKTGGKSLPKPTEVTTPNFWPSLRELNAFKLPRGVQRNPEDLLRRLKTGEVGLEDIGVTVPSEVPPHQHKRFTLGFHIGLASNTPQKTLMELPADEREQEGCGAFHSAYRPSIARGFCWAKCYLRKLYPKHRLANFANGAIRNTAILP